MNKHIFHVKDLVISRADRAAAMAGVESGDLPEGGGDKAGGGGAAGGGVVLANPIRGVRPAAGRGAGLKIATSWFQLTNSRDPRTAPSASTIPATAPGMGTLVVGADGAPIGIASGAAGVPSTMGPGGTGTVV